MVGEYIVVDERPLLKYPRAAHSFNVYINEKNGHLKVIAHVKSAWKDNKGAYYVRGKERTYPMTVDGSVGSAILLAGETAPEVYKTIFEAVIPRQGLIVGNDALSGSALLGAYKVQHFYIALQNDRPRLRTGALARGFKYITNTVEQVYIYIYTDTYFLFFSIHSY